MVAKTLPKEQGAIVLRETWRAVEAIEPAQDRRHLRGIGSIVIPQKRAKVACGTAFESEEFGARAVLEVKTPFNSVKPMTRILCAVHSHGGTIHRPVARGKLFGLSQMPVPTRVAVVRWISEPGKQVIDLESATFVENLLGIP